MNIWAEYVSALTNGDTQNTVGEKIGVDGATISRWRKGSRPGNPAEVAALALAYNDNVLRAFVAAGYLTEQEAGITPPATLDLTGADDQALVDEVFRRMKAGSENELERRRAAKRHVDKKGNHLPPSPDLGAVAHKRTKKEEDEL